VLLPFDHGDIGLEEVDLHLLFLKHIVPSCVELDLPCRLLLLPRRVVCRHTGSALLYAWIANVPLPARLLVLALLSCSPSFGALAR
jgi:hypothetical protein